MCLIKFCETAKKAHKKIIKWFISESLFKCLI
jgi:hypothetical protein